MGDFVHKEGSGSLFRNDKRTAENQPNARGEAMIGGVLYEVAAWTKEGAKGKWQSLAFKVKEARPAKPAQQSDGGLAGMKDDLPWPS